MDSVHTRLKFILWLLPILLVTSFVTSADAQEFLSLRLPGSSSFGGLLSGAEPFGPQVSSDAKIGYGHIGLNFNLPVASFAADTDLAFRDANVWIGSLGTRVDSCSGFFLALRGQGNVSRDIGIETAENPFGATRWDGPKLQWWALDSNVGYRVRPWWSVLVGLRRDQLSVGLTNPKANGVPLNLVLNMPPVSLSRQFHGDFSSKLWIPYFGLEIAGQRYRASLLYSPFASADIRVPNTFLLSLFVAVQPSVRVLVARDLEYKIRKPTQFLEYNFEYNVDLGPNFAFQVWSAGSWMQLRGKGNFDSLANVLVVIGGVPVTNVSEPFSGPDTATYTRSVISGGIGVELTF